MNASACFELSPIAVEGRTIKKSDVESIRVGTLQIREGFGLSKTLLKKNFQYVELQRLFTRPSKEMRQLSSFTLKFGSQPSII